VAVLGHAYGYINVDDRFCSPIWSGVAPRAGSLEIRIRRAYRGSHYRIKELKTKGYRSPWTITPVIRVRSKPFA
jgi:hypothetical protein